MRRILGSLRARAMLLLAWRAYGTAPCPPTGCSSVTRLSNASNASEMSRISSWLGTPTALLVMGSPPQSAPRSRPCEIIPESHENVSSAAGIANLIEYPYVCPLPQTRGGKASRQGKEASETGGTRWRRRISPRSAPVVDRRRASERSEDAPGMSRRFRGGTEEIRWGCCGDSVRALRESSGNVVKIL